ncbi:MAG: glycine zipper family protein [Azospirillaceae bacterium]|nr:glycine zipper family protein [Azospirillaceae bacterium]
MARTTTKARTLIVGACTVLALGGCVQQPLGPRVAVMPSPNKPFEVFANDQLVCKQYASQQVSGEAERANNQAVGTAVVGTVLGAGLGAAIGGGRGAAIGAGSGAVLGTAVAGGPANAAQYSLQERYDIAYQQCMYSKGNQVPGYQATPPAATYAPPPAQGYYPPPDAVPAPPPPAGYYYQPTP